jgi:competence protein ComGC
MEVHVKKSFLSAKARESFTLIELFLIVAIVAIITALAIPNMMESRKAANETSAMVMVRAINVAQIIVHDSTDKYGDVKELIFDGHVNFNSVQFTSTVFPPSIPPVEGVKSGYAFAVAPGLDLANMNSSQQLSANTQTTLASNSVTKSIVSQPSLNKATSPINQGSSVDPTQQFVVFGRPQVQTQTGDKTYCSDASGVIRFTTLPIKDLFATSPNFLIQTQAIGGQ